MKIIYKIREIFTLIRSIQNLDHKINTNTNNITNTITKSITEKAEQIKLNQGLILSNQNLYFKKEDIKKNINLAEFKVFSQWGDDGIINFLVNYLDIENKKFIEFGVEDYTECNTKLLLMMYNWEGLVIDGSQNNIDAIRSRVINWQFDIATVNKFITAENINEIISENKFNQDIGLLHIDIDGNDYWIWKEITVTKPIIVIVEYNSVFGDDRPITVPYRADFFRTDEHYSNLLFGTSLLSLCDLAEEKGYYFIGSNSNGNNAYFIRKDKIKDLKPLTCKEGFVNSKFRESLDQNHKLNFLSGDERLENIKGNKVYNTRTNSIELL